MTINQNLRRLRLDSGITQEQVAERIGVTRQALSSYESGRTRPDIDMLVRLSGVYGRDLDGILYGQARGLGCMRRIRAVSAALFALLTALTFVSALLLWSANQFFAVPEGQLSPEDMVLFTTHQRLTGAWEAVDKAILALSLLGFVLLLLLPLAGTCRLALKAKLTYIGALVGAMLAVSIPFGAADPVFGVANYLITPVHVVVRMLFFFAAGLLLEFADRRRPRRPG